MDEKAKKVLDSLEALCSKREYCRKDIMAKALKALDGDAALAREKARLTGWGPGKIHFALRAKGIEQALIEEALDTVDIQAATDKLSKLLDAKAASLEGDPQKKFKLIKFALSRGYDYDQIRDYISLY